MNVNGFQTQEEQSVPPFEEQPKNERQRHPIEDGWEVVTIDTPEGPKRVRRRRKSKPRKQSKPAVWKVVVGACILIGLFTLPLPIGQIQVTGTSQLTSEDVVHIGDLGYPVNILRVRTGALEERLQKDIRVCITTYFAGRCERTKSIGCSSISIWFCFLGSTGYGHC